MTKRLATLAGLALLCLAAGAEAQGIRRTQAAIPVSGGSTVAQLGAEMAPAIAAANWTCGAGWDCSVLGTLDKNADGVGTAAPNPALVAVVGTTYEIRFTVGLTVASGATYTWGGSPGEAPLTAAGDYIHRVTAATTASLIITPTPTATRFTITAVSIKPLTDATGDLEVQGNLTVQSPATFNGPVLISPGTGAAPALAFASAPTYGLMFGSSTVSIVAGGTQRFEISAIGAHPSGTNLYSSGISNRLWTNVYTSGGVQGARIKSLTDAAAATPVIRVPVASNGYQGGEVIWNAQSTDATDYRNTTGRIRFSNISKGATPECSINVVGTDLLESSNANTLVCTWTNVVSGANCDLSVTCTDNTAGNQTMSINFRPDMTTLAVLVYP